MLKHKNVFSYNSFSNNYASGNKGLISIQGLQVFEYKGDRFENNGDSYSEILDNIDDSSRRTPIFK